MSVQQYASGAAVADVVVVVAVGVLLMLFNSNSRVEFYSVFPIILLCLSRRDLNLFAHETMFVLMI